MIFKYMRSANRPYSPINVFDNMHGAIPKGVLLRLMDKLVADGKLTLKLFGKAQVYWVAQVSDISDERPVLGGGWEERGVVAAWGACRARWREGGAVLPASLMA